ncbi:hypothetical protein ES332_D05G316900v1 [Gossypium tomentosum]|uniref:Reverse transcriptase zinc-binding domain-containing protein n=1 Tax=Gossypium tomentosum TaxID=34277 RepID=A0A5D2L2G1_GOSTO|nr:hypothetical protein ES332_D05G316900v1 [Gossypium tomentosum]
MTSINRLPTKEFLTRRGVKLRQLERGCSWCDRELESAKYLFFQCNFIEGFWRNIFECLQVCKSLWLISVTATCWSVWLERNELVFERKWSAASNLLFHSKMQALIIGGLFWYPSAYGWVKFNVSGVANEAEAGCGGVLRNLNGVARALFFSLVAAKDSIAAEIGAIIITLDVYLAMGWKGKGSLIIEIGSNEDIENRMDKVGNISFLKAEKHGNEVAFALALAGIKRPRMFKAWC